MRSSQHRSIAVSLFVITTGLLTAIIASSSTVRAAPGDGLGWIEEFADDPLASGRFSVPAGHDPSRFSYDATGEMLTVRYETFLPTAWYTRPIDPTGVRTLGRYDDFEYSVMFRIRSEDFFSDPGNFAQIGWALINSTTTGEDRPGGSIEGPFAFDLVGFDYFPHVSFPSMGPTIIHGDDGSGYFSNIDFTFGTETAIDVAAGDDSIDLDQSYTLRLVYDGVEQVATITLFDGSQFSQINTDGAGGFGGFDGDPTTIQTFVVIDKGLEVDTFALTAWEDTFSTLPPPLSTVIANVDVGRVEFVAPAVLLGDVNRDDRVDGRDIAPFTTLMLSATPDPALVYRADFNGNGVLESVDLDQFIATLLVQ